MSQWLTPFHSRMAPPLLLLPLLPLLEAAPKRFLLPTLVGISPEGGGDEDGGNDRFLATISSTCFQRRQLHTAARHPVRSVQHTGTIHIIQG